MNDDRKHLTAREVDKLIAATKGSRNATRDRCLLLLMFRHGLRVSEAVGLVLSQIDLEGRTLHVKRLKQGLSTTHPLRGDELRVLRAWLAERAKMKPETKALFVSERRGPLSRKTAWAAIRDYGRGRAGDCRPSAHAAPRLRLRPGGPGRGHPADSGLSRTPQHSAHRALYGHQPGAI